MIVDRQSLYDNDVVVDATVHATRRSYGSRLPKSRKEKAQGAKKLKAVLQRTSGPRKTIVERNKEKASGRLPHKEYGSHDGAEHVYDLLVKGVDKMDSITDGEVNSVCNAMTRIEGYKSQIDIRAAKNKVESEDAATDAKFSAKFGKAPTEDQSLEIVREKAKHAITYYETQVVVKISSKEPFDGGILDQETGRYVQVIRSKKVYTKDIIPLSWVEANCKVSDDTTIIDGNIRQKLTEPLVLLALEDGTTKYVSQRKRADYLASGFNGGPLPS